LHIQSFWASVYGGTLLAVWSATSLAAPVVSGISGSIANGQQVQISGSGFGQKSPAKPYLWAPFENSANPSSLGIVTSWDGIQSMGYAPGEGFNGTGALKATDNSGVWTANVVSQGFGWNDYGRKMYLFRRVKQNFSVAGMNWKIIRIWPASGNQPNWFMQIGNGELAVSPPIDSYGYPHNDLTVAQGTPNVWKTEEFLTKSNSASGVSDAEFYHYVHGALVGVMTSGLRFKDDGTAPMAMAYPVHGVQANTGFPSNYRHWTDDVYMDNTWARVIVGDAPSLANCTRLDIQIPFAWSGDQIGITLNLESIPGGQPRYLFVVDANGARSSGYPLGNEAVPSSPKNVTAQ
jgi:hypothetical protein